MARARAVVDAASKVYKLDEYVQEAEVEPFSLVLSDETTLFIPAPDVETLLQLGETPIQDNRRVLQLLAGKEFDTLWLHIAGKPAGIALPLVIDMMKHFKIGNLMASPGGSRASSG